MWHPMKWLEKRWSWVIFMSSFMIQFTSMGAPFSVGVFNVEFLKYFAESRSTTSWIFSINISFLLGGGPIVAYMLRWYSHRQVVCAGIIVSTVAFASCYFANSIAALCILYGAIGGFGLAMMYLPATILVGYYYTEYRSIMTAMSTTGGWIGLIVLPKVFTYAIECYSWRGAMIILAGLTFQMMIFAILLREPQKMDYHIEVTVEREKHTNEFTDDDFVFANREKIDIDGLGYNFDCLTHENNIKKGENASSPVAWIKDKMLTPGFVQIHRNDDCHKNSPCSSIESQKYNEGEKSHKVFTVKDFAMIDENLIDYCDDNKDEIRCDDDVEKVLVEIAATNEDLDNLSADNDENPDAVVSLCTKDQQIDIRNQESFSDKEHTCNGAGGKLISKDEKSNVKKDNDDKGLDEMNGKKDAVLNSTVNDEIEQNQIESDAINTNNDAVVNLVNLNSDSVANSITNEDLKRGFNQANIDYHIMESTFKIAPTDAAINAAINMSNNTKLHQRLLPKKACDEQRSTWDDIYAVVSDFGMSVYIWSNIFWNTGTIMQAVFITDLIIVVCGRNLTDASTALSAQGVGGVVGAILAGALGNSKHISVTLVYTILCILVGILSFMFVLTTNYTIIVIISVLHGVLFGGIVGILLVVTAELIADMRLLGLAFGYLMLPNGIGNLIGPPIGGYLFDVTGSYNLTFYVAGVVNIMSGLIMALIPIKKRYFPRGGCFTISATDQPSTSYTTVKTTYI